MATSDFIYRYGNYSEDFPLVNADGSAHISIALLYILTSIISIIGFSLSINFYNKIYKNTDNKKDKIKHIINNICFYLGLIFISCSILLLLYSFYNSLSYYGEFSEWYSLLPENGRLAYNQIQLLREVKSLNNRLRSVKR